MLGLSQPSFSLFFKQTTELLVKRRENASRKASGRQVSRGHLPYFIPPTFLHILSELRTWESSGSKEQQHFGPVRKDYGQSHIWGPLEADLAQKSAREGSPAPLESILAYHLWLQAASTVSNTFTRPRGDEKKELFIFPFGHWHGWKQ